MDLDLKSMNRIIKKIIGKIDSSRDEVFNIVDGIRKDKEDLKEKIKNVRDRIKKVINEADELEKKDKKCRKRLALVSSNFRDFSEEDIKKAYETASDTRLRYFSKKEEEKSLREERDKLERALKTSIDNIETGERILNQIGIAMGFLEGDISSLLNEADKNSEMFVGIKILEAQENERKRIARDIHDGPAQHMANVVMRVDICKMIIKKDIGEGLNELDDLKESVKAALTEVRSIIFDLRPMSLDDLGLSQTIQQMINKMSKDSGIAIGFRIKPVKEEVEPIIQVAVYRIIQEILNNMRKHSKAKNAEVKLDFGTKYLMLVISDDGIGFDVDKTLSVVKTKGASYGLIGILERVKQLQGEIDIKSSKEKGTKYIVKLPINRQVISDEKESN